MSAPLTGLGAVSSAMVLFSGANVLVAAISASGVVTALYRLWLAAAVLAVVLHLTGRLPSVTVLRAAVPGGIAYATSIWFLFTAFQTTSLANATIILASQAGLTLTVVGRLFGERVRPGDFALAAVATAGVVLAVVGGEAGGSGNVRGDVLAVFGMLANAAYVMLGKKARVRAPAGEYQLGLLLVSAIVTVPAVVVLGEAPGTVAGWDLLLLVLLTALATTGHLGLNWAHRHVPLKATSLLMLLVPVMSTALAWVALGERLGATQALGIAVTLGALVGVIVRAVSPVAGAAGTEPVDPNEQ